MILGIPAAAHREALLRETAGGGRVATSWACARCGRRGWVGECAACGSGTAYGPSRAIILHDPADPEAGAMGLARLAWMAGGVTGTPIPPPAAWVVPTWDGGSVWLENDDVSTHWTPRSLPALATATNAAHAIALVCVHLGLLDRVEVAP